jgi:hypothetical protein
MLPTPINSVTYVYEQQKIVLPICMNCVTHVYESNVTHVSDCTVLDTPLRRARDLAMRNESQGGQQGKKDTQCFVPDM